MAESENLRDRLRALPVFPGELPRFNTDRAPESPLALLTEWLDAAIDAGVLQPHAMSLATATFDGHVSNRTLLLKDVDEHSLWFATLSSSPKGRDLEANPHVALALYWREQGRQIRIVGEAQPGPRDVSDRDFLQRSPMARARAAAGSESEPVDDFAAHLAPTLAKIEADPGFVTPDWVAYRVVPRSIEFWQAERERDQVRLRYLRDGDGWSRDILWP